VVARIGGDVIRADQLDATLRLRLYDLDEARYRLRRAQLDQLVAKRLGLGASDPERVAVAEAAGEVEILLEPPERPRVPIDSSGAPSRGADDAPVVVMEFCDFESVHCQRIQPALRALLEAHASHVRLVHRDNPLPFHRHAHPAAEAARCAGEQPDGYWRFHDGLYLDPQRLDRERFLSLAGTLGLDVPRFRSCLDEHRRRDAVDEDATTAQRLGLRSVPVTFVNGIYVKGPATRERLREIVETELVRLGVAPPAAGADIEAAPPSRLPVTLVGTVVSPDPQRSLAAIESEVWRATRLFSPGQEVLEGAVVADIRPQSVLLRRPDGSHERLRLRAPPNGAPDPPPALATRADGESGGVMHLSREAVDHALERRPELEKRLSPGRLDVEGKHLLKLGEVEPGSLYDALGLVPGDVIMQVDGVFVHDQHNPLWEALRTRSRVTVTVMRKGFPKTFEYAIE
jgi:protein-disulfide isomerase/type II secretory pathway component PulC